jgi:hypothetical protein
MLTEREFLRNAFRCGIYEGQDVLADIDEVDLIYLKPAKGYKLRRNLHERIIWHDITRRIVATNVAFEPVRLTKEYDVFIAYCQQFKDVMHIPAIHNWRDHCRTSICWIDELWAGNVPDFKSSWLPALREFDHIALALNGTVKPLSEAMGKPCHFVPAGVDTIRFSPYPHPPARVIDVYNIGRIAVDQPSNAPRAAWEGLHQALLKLAANKNIFYVYDTFHATDTQVRDHRQHREMLANMAKRSRYFLVAPAKMNFPEETSGQIEVGFRYYEGSAAGAIMLGQVPDCESFNRMFDWPDAVVKIRPDGSDVADVLGSLAAQPKRVLEISRRNGVEALLRHDWVYRWKQILNIVGLKPAPELEIRENRLKQMAERVGNEE